MEKKKSSSKTQTTTPASTGSKPFYTIRQLINRKYGEEKFALGCEIVARWVNGSIKQKSTPWSAADVLDMCNDTEGRFGLFQPEAEVLRRLFGLQSTEQLFT